MSLLLLLRSAVAGASTTDGPILDEDDRIENGEPFIALQIGGKTGRPLVLPYYGACGDAVSGRAYASLQVGENTSAPLNALTSSRCDGTMLPTDAPLLGVHIGGKSGLPLILASCEGCCLCEDVTSHGTATIASAAYSGSIPIYYSNDLRGTFGGVLGNSLPDDIAYDTNPVPGWGGYLYPNVNVSCGESLFPAFNLQVFVRRCDMKIWIACYYSTSISSGRQEMYSVCEDAEDVIDCDPFSVVRRMNLYSPVAWRNPNSGSGLPFISCTGTGEDCDGEEFITLSIP